jgi:16S rRNA (cytosine967-C5)-methyltransferase
MGPTLSHAANVVAASRRQPADAVLREYLGRHDRLRPGEKRAISRAVFAYFRWWRWLDQEAALPVQVGEAVDQQARFDRDPLGVKAEALAARAVPEWLKDEMDLPAEFLRQLQREPVLWLRARPGSGAALAGRLGACTAFAPPTASGGPPPPGATDALRYAGPTNLFLTEEFRTGAFEIQDLASQWVSWVAAPQPGETWWDACAGEGGKALHLADLMANRGVVWATDRSARRLDVVRRRASRAKLFNLRIAARAPRGPIFDGILVDAPCSGVGTWQRNPHARWSTTPIDVRELAQVQAQLLAAAAGQLKPGGRLIYSVCTLTRSETAGVINAFTAAHPDLEPLALAVPGQPAGAPGAVLLWPQCLESNGMAVAAWRRR